MNILDKIILHKQKEVEENKKVVSVKELEASPLFGRTPFSLKQRLITQEHVGIIAEFKRKSPSKGIINDRNTPQEIAQGYVQARAAAMSVLTDQEFFAGTGEDLQQARKVVDIPLLRKEFIIDEYQLLEAKAMGADLILLISACLEPARLKALAEFAQSLGLEVLMEVHNQEELDATLNPCVDLVGVNNRNLKTFEVSIQTSLDLAAKIPAEFVKISESGLRSVDNILELEDAGFQGFLIGETFMKTEDPARTCRELIQAVEKARK